MKEQRALPLLCRCGEEAGTGRRGGLGQKRGRGKEMEEEEEEKEVRKRKEGRGGCSDLTIF